MPRAGLDTRSIPGVSQRVMSAWSLLVWLPHYFWPCSQPAACCACCAALQDPERKETDLWGSRGVFLAGAMMTYMAVMNFLNTVVSRRGRQRPGALCATCNCLAGYLASCVVRQGRHLQRAAVASSTRARVLQAPQQAGLDHLFPKPVVVVGGLLGKLKWGMACHRLHADAQGLPHHP